MDDIDDLSKEKSVSCPTCGKVFVDLDLDVAIAMQMNHIRRNKCEPPTEGKAE